MPNVAPRIAEDRRWTAVVLAGQRPGGDPLAAHFGVALKALVPVGGMPMLERVLHTLGQVPRIGRILVLAQDSAALEAALPSANVTFAPSQASIAATLQHLIAGDEPHWPMLVTTADHALLTPDMVEAFLDEAGASDASVGLVERRVLLARYPHNRRTWLKLRGGAYSGANLFAFAGPQVLPLLDQWAAIEQDRKKGWRIAAGFGPMLLLRAATRTITIQAALARIGARFGIAIRPVLLPQAEAAIDVDKPDDHALAEAILAARGAA